MTLDALMSDESISIMTMICHNQAILLLNIENRTDSNRT